MFLPECVHVPSIPEPMKNRMNLALQLVSKCTNSLLSPHLSLKYSVAT